ncbi:DUF2442 domain-containing protein [Desulfobulbus sp. F4]|nr:DUF2442 domain-containing protein [Desulfobulbus sp. F4]
MKECVYLLEAKYLDGFRVFVRFNTGEAGEVDLHDLIFKYKAAASLQTPQSFAAFYLDSWPTLAWKCGFDIAPETLLARLTGSA